MPSAVPTRLLVWRCTVSGLAVALLLIAATTMLPAAHTDLPDGVGLHPALSVSAGEAGSLPPPADDARR